MNNPKWFGIGINYLEAPQEIPLIKSLGFNTVRLAFRFGTSLDAPHVDSAPLLDYNIFDSVLEALNLEGIRCIADVHNYQDMYGLLGTQELIDKWVEFALKYRNDGRIVAYEAPMNEPGTPTWAPNITGGGCGVPGEDVVAYLAQLFDAIRAVDPLKPIIWSDPWYWRPRPDDWWNPETVPLAFCRDAIVTFHNYAHPSSWNSSNYVQMMSEMLARIDVWNAKYKCWAGEFGMIDKYSALEIQFLADAITAYVDRSLGFNFWMHGYPDRLLARQRITDAVNASTFTGVLPFPVWVPTPISLWPLAPLAVGLALSITGLLV